MNLDYDLLGQRVRILVAPTPDSDARSRPNFGAIGVLNYLSITPQRVAFGFESSRIHQAYPSEISSVELVKPPVDYDEAVGYYTQRGDFE